MKILLVVLLSVLIFLAGYFFGSVSLTWTSPKYASTVAFWAMIGGWISSILTFIAVAVSLFMAYQATQNDKEKILLKTKMIGKHFLGDSWDVSIEIINLRSIHTKVEDVFLVIDSKKSTRISHLLEGRAVPFLLTFKGEMVRLKLTIDAGNLWWPIFRQFDESNDMKFKKGFYLIHTPLQTYKVPLSDEVLKIIKERYERFKAMP
ncbi:TPA: hypothetical protein I4G69_001723 [Enterobacter asburiae]|nr:hypothetical protein [Enterobacter asburiae]